MVEPFDDIEAWASLESLYDKAIQSPSEITLEEKHTILEWPSLEHMEETTQKYVGKSLRDLIHTAANDPLALTYPDCCLIKDGFHIFRTLDAVKYSNDRRKRMIGRPDLWNKWQQARDAVLPPDELKALENVREVFLANIKAYSKPIIEAAERSRTHPPDWVQSILDRDGKGWGYVIYRPSVVHEREGNKEAWRACWDNFNELLSFHPVMVIGGEEIQDSKVVDFVDYEPEMGGVDQLRLYAWAWAIDPDWSLPGPDADGYDGRVKITWAQLFNKFYGLMSIKKVNLKEIWEEFHEVNKKLPEPLPGWLSTKLPRVVWPDN
ncbi:uncharacterized protein NFIA_072660 [Aspergillus fischeri NRRL 181]|uniref:Uncharacterized protein n=1 Tax=Neosartorya fischeri (strain ATCC 1020 / DSM 3700 / CBS 544.65 / FGSC A1164 / JCM 1740 / NRRL 181 / WB 181) TaxID=331117 RepID=A1DD95_NEOFI|nr:uncharacterized protein NFIA_072660 [Aspergillus fischeri NRRL 181]EAW17352.1 hypothetical protein NFIA_072660 [Aspergillus fischeri NRRL 181]